MNRQNSRAPEDRRASATLASRQRDTGSSYKESTSGTIAGIAAIEIETGALHRAHMRRAGRFLRGPIPMNDIATAARLPGQALAVFLAVHHRQALTKTQRVNLPKGLLGELGVTKDAKARALRALEGAGLVRVERRSGRSSSISCNDKET